MYLLWRTMDIVLLSYCRNVFLFINRADREAPPPPPPKVLID